MSNAKPEKPPLEERRGPLAWMAQNHVAANILMLVLVVGGIGTLFTGIKQEVFPEIELDKILINVPYPGASPEEVEQGIVLAVEEAIQGIDGAKEVRAYAREGSAMIFVDLHIGTDPDRILSDMKSAVDRITSFPEDIERPVVSLLTNRRQVLTLVVFGEKTEQELKNLAEASRRALLLDERVSYVEIAGARPLEIAIEVPQQKLRQHGLTLSEISSKVRNASVDVPAGSVKTPSGEVLLRAGERRYTGSEFGDIVLRSRPDGSTLRVRDVAQVTDGFREVDQKALYHGQRAILVNVYRVGDETPIEVSAAVYDHMKEAADALPPGVSLDVWNDRSEIYADRIALLKKNAYLGLALVLLILGLFLEPKLAFWVTLGIPISFLGSILFLPSADVSLNMVSLFAFIVTLGMVVDDAIVVGEAIHEQHARGKRWHAAAVAGVREVARPVIFAILTTCIAFTPLLFVPGTMGKFFQNIPIVVIIVLLISLLESLLVLPAHLSHPMPRGLQILLWPVLKPISLLRPDLVGAWLKRFVDRRYAPFLGFALRWRYLTVAIAAAAFLGTLGVVQGGLLKFTFMPKIESDVVSASLSMPVGTPVDETERQHAVLQAALKKSLKEVGASDKDVRGIFSEIGIFSPMRGAQRAPIPRTGSHLTSVVAYLVSSDQRDFTAGKLVKAWRRNAQIAGADSLLFKYETGHSGGDPIDVRLSHDDTEVLDQAALRLARELERYDGVRDIDSGVASGKEQLQFRLRPEGKARGLTESALARQVRSAFYGSEAIRQQRGRDELRVYVRRPLHERERLQDVEELIIRTPDGGEIPVGAAAVVVRGRAYTQIKRSDGRREIAVTADVTPGQANANDVIETLQKRELLALTADVPGLTFRFGGQHRRQKESLEALKDGFTLALLAMTALLAIAFRSYSQPLVVMSVIPIGFVGAILGHLLMGYDLSLMSMMGIVALSGVVVNDSLILIVAINELRASGQPLLEAVVNGCRRRFRPILLTSLTTFFGLAPMILEPSVQARFLVPMAISLGFGVLFATFIMLFLVPALVLVVEDLRRLLGVEDSAEEEEEDELSVEAAKNPG